MVAQRVASTNRGVPSFHPGGDRALLRAKLRPEGDQHRPGVFSTLSCGECVLQSAGWNDPFWGAKPGFGCFGLGCHEEGRQEVVKLSWLACFSTVG